MNVSNYCNQMLNWVDPCSGSSFIRYLLQMFWCVIVILLIYMLSCIANK